MHPDPPADEAPSPSPGLRTLAALVIAYAAAVAAATYPYVLTLGSRLPSRIDPAQHLTILRWYRTCLLEGRSPLVLSELQYPTGAPLGNFSPLHLEALLYLPLSFVIPNDVLCYNILWLGGFLLTGLGTFGLAWQVVRDRLAAAFAGLAAMLGGTMMLHAHGHLELMYVGTFPLFLAAWMRFVDRPDRRRLFAAAGLYVLVTMAAAYFAVLAVIPAAFYAAWAGARAGRGRLRTWLRGRFAWSLAFVATVLPPLIVLFAGQLWAVAHGLAMGRPRAEFNHYGAPAWSYVLPTLLHPLGALLHFDGYDARGYPGVECGAYLGVVTLGLMLYAAIGRARFPRAGYWWATFLLLAVLSFGAYGTIGSVRIPLPASWLWKHFFAFRLIRVPARFNLFATVCAAVIAAAGLRHLLGGLRRPAARAALAAALGAVAVADLSMVPFGLEALPPMPSAYAKLLRRDPAATFVEAPQFASGECHALNALPGYWQASHRGRTTAGYSGHDNGPFDLRLVRTSPFYTMTMIAPDYLADPSSARFGLVSGADARAYAWLYLHANDLRYVVVHDWAGAIPEFPVHTDRLKALLAGAKVIDEGGLTIYDRERLPRPVHPALIPIDGFRASWPARPCQVVGPVGTLAVYSPSAETEMTLTLTAAAFRRSRSVRLVCDGAEQARWQITPGEVRDYASPPFRLPAGRHALTLLSDGQDAPRKRREQASESDPRPYSLSVTGLRLEPAAPRVAARPE